MSAPREKTDLIVYFVPRCRILPECEEIDLGIDQYVSDAWNAFTAHCRDAHPEIVTKKPMIRTTTWTDAPADAAAVETPEETDASRDA